MNNFHVSDLSFFIFQGCLQIVTVSPTLFINTLRMAFVTDTVGATDVCALDGIGSGLFFIDKK